MNTKTLWQFATKPSFRSGFVYGLRYPALTVTVSGTPLTPSQQKDIQTELTTLVPQLALPAPLTPETTQSPWSDTANWWLQLACQIQVGAQQPMFDTAKLRQLGDTHFSGAIPCLPNAANTVAQCLQALLQWLNTRGLGAEAQQTAAQTLRQHLELLIKLRPASSNTPRFIKAAFQSKVPFRLLPGNTIQYGQGSHACWLDSTHTHQTSVLGSKLARHKLHSQALLRSAGLPVPDHAQATTEEAAVQIAHRLGYPVVVKPIDLDGGHGVAADLRNEAEVRSAFKTAQKLSKNILVEKHVQGKDYRLTIFHDSLLWVTERQPGGVTGDGLSTIEALVKKLNTDPRRGNGLHASLVQLEINAEAYDLLAQQKLTLQSVPANGQFIRLRRASNIASGGTPVPAFDRTHPHNAELAIRAAQALGLDIAGIDLLIPDISVSWQETGAYICEVNSQPSLGLMTTGHLYAPILKKLLKGDGRIPVIVVAGAADNSPWPGTLRNALAAQGLRVGLASKAGVWRDQELLVKNPITAFAATQILTLNRQVDAIILNLQDDSVLKMGLPVESIDALLIAGQNYALASEGKLRLQQISLLIQQLAASCDGELYQLPGSGLHFPKTAVSTPGQWQSTAPTLNDADAITQKVITRRQRLSEHFVSNLDTQTVSL